MGDSRDSSNVDFFDSLELCRRRLSDSQRIARHSKIRTALHIYSYFFSKRVFCICKEFSPTWGEFLRMVSGRLEHKVFWLNRIHSYGGVGCFLLGSRGSGIRGK